MYPQPKKLKAGANGMFIALVGGGLVLISPFLLFYISISASSGPFQFFDEGIFSILDLQTEYAYCWLIVVAGILALFSSPTGYSMQSRGIASIVLVSGILAIIIPFVLAFQMADEGGASFIDIFYTSVSGGVLLFLGGILAIIGGLVVLIGGVSLIAGIHGAIKEFESLEGAPAVEEEHVDPAEVERIRQGLKEEREQAEERMRLEEGGEEYFSSTIELDVPTSLGLEETSVIEVNVRNDGGMTVKNLSLDLSDVETYFQVMGSVRFMNIEPGEEVSGSVKIKPLKGEGIYPILIEIKEDGNTVEKRYSIKVEGTDSY